MTPKLLQTFLAVSRLRNFTHAAAERSLSQPAVSRQMQELERELGVELFERLGKEIHLTPAGETLSREAASLLGDHDRLLEAVRAHAKSNKGRLRIGAGTTPGLYMLPHVLSEFRRIHPEVVLSYSIGPSDDIVRMVQANEIDVGFVGRPVQAAAILVRVVAQDEIECIAASHHPAARRKAIDLRTLLDETWVVRPRGSATRELFDAWLIARKMQLQRTIEMVHPEGIRELVAANVGLSYMSSKGVQKEVEQHRIAVLNVKGLRLKRSIFAIQHVDKCVLPTTRALLNLMLDLHGSSDASSAGALFARSNVKSIRKLKP